MLSSANGRFRDPLDAARPDSVYVGALVGESTSTEFRLAVAKEAVREQDIIAVDVTYQKPDAPNEREEGRVWAKVQRIERINALFPTEAGHELAATHTNPLATVLSMSRELVTAVCQVLGMEDRAATAMNGKLRQVRYPPQPASSAYRPTANDLKRIVVGALNGDAARRRGVNLGHLANRPDIEVIVDGHAIVSRHLAILAMTGAGKSVTARRIVEELATKNYPMVIFDPHGDYSGLADVPELRGKVTRYYADLPILEQDEDAVMRIIDGLAFRKLTDPQKERFGAVFRAAQGCFGQDHAARHANSAWLAQFLGKPGIQQYGVKSDLWLVADIAEAAHKAIEDEDTAAKEQLREWGWSSILRATRTDLLPLRGIAGAARGAAKPLKEMQDRNRLIRQQGGAPLPEQREKIVEYGKIALISLSGYSGEFQATLYSLIAESIFQARVEKRLAYSTLLVLEEAHNFVPAYSTSVAEDTAIATTKKIAQEGRKFGVGLVLISQRPSRLDETVLSQCNSFIIMRLVNPADQSFVRKVVESLGSDDTRLLPDLDVGEALLSGQMVNFPVLARIAKPKSVGEREEEDAFRDLEAAHRAQRQNGAANVGGAPTRNAAANSQQLAF